MPPARRLVVHLLTGFLGGGKTTVLSHLLSAPGFPRARTAIVVNDFGEVNVDAALLSHAAARTETEGEPTSKIARLAELSAGCVCCTSSPQLGQTLLDLADDPGLDQAWLEASGMAETDDLLDRLTDPRLVARIEVGRIVHVLDASAYPGWWTNRTLAREQLRWATLLVVNKADRANPKALAKIDEDIARLNRTAPRIDAVRGAITLPEEPLSHRPAPTPTPGALHLCGCGHDHSHEPDHPHGHTPPVQGHPGATLFLPLPAPVAREKLDALLASAPGEIYRAKGFLAFDDAPEEVALFQKAGEQAETIVWKAGKIEVPSRGLVLLGREIDAPAMRAHFAALG
ncbi:GTPase, G3E family [Verrucomicrobium sp. GAS474]|uniref:CobW family GTP-binding protein n=1 Tax=Verrucomicrobium sp. GAS474 TaxID=1882831 RepID=UPI00087AE450|nr:GTP-binding protein [Verrucomicrobium sp. GAS474]SDT99416.1 GTPase, G3E family [Verrucomicrobium sp. GAS474]